MLASGVISEIALIFVTNQDFDAQLDKTLAILGSHLGVSRCYLFIDSAGADSNAHEWCAEGVESRIEELKDAPFSSIPSWKHILDQRAVYAVEDVSLLDAEVGEGLEVGTLSFILSPLHLDDRAIGFLGIDECTRRRSWTEDERETLKTVSGIISTAFAKTLITERLAASEKNLRVLLDMVDNLVEGARLGTWDWNVQTGEAVFNERWAALVGYTLAELSPTGIETWRRMAHPDDLAESDRLLKRHFEGVSDFYEAESRIRHKNGNWLWVLDRGKVTERDVDGRPTKMYGTRVDITEKKTLEQQIRELAIRDPLTDVYNRRYLFERLDEIVAEFSRRGRNFCISILDLDHFKAVNDTYGHEAGDFVLKEFSQVLLSSVRQYDLLGRYGGEEFIIVSMSAGGAETAALIGRVMALIREKVFLFEGRGIRFTFSCGIADSGEFSQKKFSAEAMIALADMRLYAAKREGRDRCVGP